MGNWAKGGFALWMISAGTGSACIAFEAVWPLPLVGIMLILGIGCFIQAALA